MRALIVATLALVSSVASAQRNLPDVGAIDSAVRAQVDSGFVGVVLVASADRVLLNRAYSHSTTLRPDDAFWIASMTKGFTAAAVLRLQKDGRLKVTDSISRFLRDVPPDKRGITIHQLLTHTAGLGGEDTGGGIADRSRAVQAILTPDLLSPPGSKYKYGDDDYELLAAIVEIVSGKTWEEYLQKNFLNPLHLAHTGFACRLKTRSLSPLACDWGRKGANGMYSTAYDVLKWNRALMSDTNSQINQPQIFVRKDGDMDVSYGYGVRIYTENGKVAEIVHSGRGDDGHTSIARNMSAGLTVIVLSNAGQHKGTTWASFIAHQVVR